LTFLLTPGQTNIWELRLRGHRAAEISRQMGKSRQYVSKSLQSADSKIYRALAEAARMNKAMIKVLDPERGFALGYTREFDSSILITFSPRDGINIWRSHEGQCKGCPDEVSCRRLLLGEAERLGVALEKKEKDLPAARLAGVIFTRAWPQAREVFGEDQA